LLRRIFVSNRGRFCSTVPGVFNLSQENYGELKAAYGPWCRTLRCSAVQRWSSLQVHFHFPTSLHFNHTSSPSYTDEKCTPTLVSARSVYVLWRRIFRVSAAHRVPLLYCRRLWRFPLHYRHMCTCHCTRFHSSFVVAPERLRARMWRKSSSTESRW
jgi:hypothetical protein